MLKPSDNPPSIPPDITSLRELTARWCVVQTKARAEKALVWALLAIKAGFFIPMTTKVTFSGGRKRTGKYPLFQGYIFVSSNEEWWHVNAASRHVSRIIPMKEQKSFVDELAELERAMAIDPTAVLYPGIVSGRRYRVTAGPQKGLRGIAVQFHGSTHVVLSVSVLGQGAALPVDASLLEPDED